MTTKRTLVAVGRAGKWAAGRCIVTACAVLPLTGEPLVLADHREYEDAIKAALEAAGRSCVLPFGGAR